MSLTLQSCKTLEINYIIYQYKLLISFTKQLEIFEDYHFNDMSILREYVKFLDIFVLRIDRMKVNNVVEWLEFLNERKVFFFMILI